VISERAKQVDIVVRMLQKSEGSPVERAEIIRRLPAVKAAHSVGSILTTVKKSQSGFILSNKRHIWYFDRAPDVWLPTDVRRVLRRDKKDLAVRVIGELLQHNRVVPRDDVVTVLTWIGFDAKNASGYVGTLLRNLRAAGIGVTVWYRYRSCTWFEAYDIEAAPRAAVCAAPLVREADGAYARMWPTRVLNQWFIEIAAGL